MKLRTVAIASMLGMLSSSAAAYVMTDGPRPARAIQVAMAAATSAVDLPEPPGPRFVAGEVLRVEGRLGHEQLSASGSRETYVMFEVAGGEGAGRKRAPLDIALVIDRSGSMAGGRIESAVRAAVGLVEGLSDGDVVSAITFDTGTELLVPATAVSAETRPDIVAALRRIVLGGDTCISCGIERARAELARTQGRVDRMIVLSDGRANHGVRDLVGLARIAEEAREAEVAITTVGLGFDYNEKTLAQLASASNGSHHFVPDASALDTVFAAEAAAASASVAAECMAHVKLAEGVELLEVVDRAHRQTDGGVAVPLGAFSPGERKTVLLRVRLPAGGEGNEGVASLELRYRDLGMDGEGMVAGALAVSIVSDTDGALDPLVDLRLQRRRTAAALKEASRLFEGGRLEAARRVLEDNARDIDRARHPFEPGMPRERDPRRTDILGDLATQSRDTQASLDNLRQAEQLRGQRRRGFVLDNQMMMNPYFD